MVGLDYDYLVERPGNVKIVGWAGYSFRFFGTMYDVPNDAIELPDNRYFTGWHPDFKGDFQKFEFKTKDNRTVKLDLTSLDY